MEAETRDLYNELFDRIASTGSARMFEMEVMGVLQAKTMQDLPKAKVETSGVPVRVLGETNAFMGWVSSAMTMSASRRAARVCKLHTLRIARVDRACPETWQSKRH